MQRDTPDIVAVEIAAAMTSIPAKSIMLLLEFKQLTSRASGRVSIDELRSCEVNVGEATRLLGFSENAGRIYQYITSGDLKAVKKDGYLVMKLGDVADTATRKAHAPRGGRRP